MRNLVKRSEIVLVDFDFAIGSEQSKVRPALIIQDDVSNMYSPVTIIAAITSQSKPYPSNVFIRANGFLTKDGYVLTNQLRTIDKSRIHKSLGFISPDEMKEVNEALKKTLALDI